MRQLKQLLELGLREIPRDGAVLLLRVQRRLPETAFKSSKYKQAKSRHLVVQTIDGENTST
jgi:hypothetical protein